MGRGLINIFKQYLQPYLIDGIELVRIGCANDGGYVIPKNIIDDCTKVISVGIGQDIEFEKHLLQLNDKLIIYCFDHTIKSLPAFTEQYAKNFVYFAKGLGVNHDKLIDVATAYSYCEIKDDDVLMFKMDAEGAEWSCGFKDFDFSKTACIVIELHSLIREYKYAYYAECLSAICNDHLCIHVHGNNACGLFEYEGLYYPGMMEVTFINKKYIADRQYAISPFSAPRHVDQRNVCRNGEVVFKYW